MIGEGRRATRRSLLVDIVADDGPRWHDRAACIGVDPEIFFPWRGEVEKIAEAKAVCAGCEVRAECLDEALRRNERHGVFGGMTERERRRVRRQRGEMRREPPPRVRQEHGTGGYRRGCRCEVCRAAKRDEMRRVRQKEPVS